MSRIDPVLPLKTLVRFVDIPLYSPSYSLVNAKDYGRRMP